MPSPRATPATAMRPSSPLSPRFESPARFDSLQPPSSRSVHSRTPAVSSSHRHRPASNSLKLPALPRFHPANFPSAHSSVQGTPESNYGSPQPPVSPRTHQRMYSDAQKQLYFFQRESLAAAARAASPVATDNPASPRLDPIMGSPGPVTPLELEREDGYLVAGVRNKGRDAPAADEIVEHLIKEEARRRRDSLSYGTKPSAR